MLLDLRSLFESFAQAAAPIVVAGLWQGLVISAGLALCLKVTPRMTAAQRFLVWSAAFAALAALPLAGIAIRSFGASATGYSTASPHPWLQFDARWTFVLAGLWLVASAVRAIDLLIHALRLRRLGRTATPIDLPASHQTTCAFEVCSTQSLDRPSVIGFFAPRILIPAWLLPRLSEEELHQIVLHESEHLRRRDDWTNLFQKICLVLFPWNPALWGIDRQLAKEREMACDEAVVRITQAPRAYAACLASLAERGLAHRKEALSLGAWQRRSELVHRVHSILRRKHLMHPIAARALLGAVACGLFVVTAGLARCPQLVAFVPSPQAAPSTSLINQSAQLGDAVYRANPHRAQLAQGFFAEQAKAEMPSTPDLKPSASRAPASLKTAAAGELRASAEPSLSNPGVRAHRAEQLALRQPAPAGESPNQQHPDGQGWIVFTAWEQVETAATPDEKSSASTESLAEKTGTTADYDTGASPAAASSSAAPNTNSTTSRMRVTQLIFKVLPADSKSTHTAAVPFGDGWIVIQL
jgi:beta-lactamase regulating signal transducer with metallopeptidase domain